MVNSVLLPIDRNKPLAFAPITLCEGAQGAGKSNYAVSEVVDVTFQNATSIKLVGGQEFKVAPLLDDKGFAKIGWVKVLLPNNKIIETKCPVGSCVRADGVRIYANFHFYGIKASYLTMPEILEGLNNGTISYGYLILDEHYMGGNARESMNPVVKAITKLSNQMRKKHIYLTYITPYARQLDWIERASVRKNIYCEDYNEDTHIITYVVRQKGQRGTRTKTYDASTYFPYYWTDEHFEMSEQSIGSAIAASR